MIFYEEKQQDQFTATVDPSNTSIRISKLSIPPPPKIQTWHAKKYCGFMVIFGFLFKWLNWTLEPTTGWGS